MIKIDMLPEILKMGKMVLNLAPFFSVELIIEGPVELIKDAKRDILMISNDSTRVVTKLFEKEETLEYRMAVPLGDKEYETMYDLFSDAMFFALKYMKKLVNWKLDEYDLETDPRTIAFFNKTTYNKIMNGIWAADTVIFECERTDGDVSDTKYASFANMKREAVKRLKLLKASKKQISEFETSNRIPFVFAEGDKITKRFMRGTELLMTHRVLAEKGFYPYYAIKQKGQYMDGTEFDKVTFLVVTKYYKDWERSREMLDSNIVESYVVNLDIPEYSEFAEVTVKNVKGCLISLS